MKKMNPTPAKTSTVVMGPQATHSALPQHLGPRSECRSLPMQKFVLVRIVHGFCARPRDIGPPNTAKVPWVGT